MSSENENKPSASGDDTSQPGGDAVLTADKHFGAAAFQAKYALRDAAAGVITGTMAIPLSIGIAMMSDYPIKVGLATVVFASFICWMMSWFRPGNYIGSPGIAAGLAPALALGVSAFGMENMAFCIFLTAVMQAVCWHYNWQKYLLVAVPVYLVEGLLAGIGLKIMLKFFEFTYELPAGSADEAEFWNSARITMCAISAAGMGVFLVLFSKFKDVQPAIPYFVLIIGGVIIAQFIQVPMIEVEDIDLYLRLPWPEAGTTVWMFILMVLFCAMLATIDVIEQVMSNAAIEKLDPLKRKCNSNNSLLAIWMANMGASFFGGMTNLDGLAKSTTNRLAGAYTKFSIVFIGSVVGFFLFNSEYLEFLPKFALAAIMIFSGYKMIAGLVHVTHYGPYAMMLAIATGLLVFELGIFEGLIIALIVHAIIHYMVYTKHDNMPGKDVIKRYFENLKKDSGNLQ